MGDFDRKSDGSSTASSTGATSGAVGKQTLVAQRYGAIQRRKTAGAEGDAPVSATGGGGAALPAPVQSKMEQSFGIDLSGVRMHEGTEASAVGAQAFARGTDVHFAPGQYDPHSQGGQELIGHELAHVVQQSQGRVGSTTQPKGMALNDDPGLEREADEMGARAARGEPAGGGAAGVVSSGGIVQLKREPISPEGMKVLDVAKTYYALINSKRKFQKSTIDRQAQRLTEAATNLDLTKERNEEFANLMKVFATSLHAHSFDKLRVLVEQKFDALGVELKAEADKKDEAEQQETKEGGHALGRHGPSVSDDALIRRLHTGIAPDDELVPAPGASSRFNSYTDVMETRQKAAKELQTELATAAGKVVTWLSSVPGLDQAHKNAKKDLDDRTLELATATTDKVNAYKPTSGLTKIEKDKKLEDFKQAGTNKKNAEGAEKTAKDEKDNPGKNLKRVLPSMTKVKFDIQDDAGPGELADGVTLCESYGITVENGHPIGSGFESDDGDAIRLKDVLAAVSVNDPPDPKPLSDIKLGLQGLGVGGDVDELADYLNDSANLANVKKRGEKGGKIYKATKNAGKLTKSYTNFKQGTSDGKMFDAHDQPLVINTTGWDAIQHFPAPSGAAVGMD